MYEINSDLQSKKIAIYARVSTEHEAQLSALENQLDWYKPILSTRPNWVVVEQYVDEGITGTSAKKRPRFMRMIEDAKAHKFDMIITREVSRFARNTVDTLQYTRLLKEYKVEVFFINDNIKTFDGDGELRLTLMATLAQDESRKTSIRVKAGQQTSMENGVYYGNGNILGYDRVGKDYVINEEQAKTVRMIFDMYLSGMGVTKIMYELESQGRLTAKGNKKWHTATITHMLDNSFYCGIVTYHKEFTPNYLVQKKVKNYGDVELIKIEGRHTPIVTKEEFDKVQKIKANKRNKMDYVICGKKASGHKPFSTAFGRLMVCKCGKNFNQRLHSREGRTDGVDYQCYASVNRGSIQERKKKGLSTEGCCDSPYLAGWKLYMMAERIFETYIDNQETVANLAYNIVEKKLKDSEEDDFDIQRKRKNLEERIEKLNKKKENLIELRVEGDIDKDTFHKKKNEIEVKLSKLQSTLYDIQKADVNKETPNDYTQKLQELNNRLKEYSDFDYTIIPDNIIEAFIAKIWVSKDEFRWYLRTGKEDTNNFDFENHIKIGSFTITKEEAQKYVYSFSTRRRVLKWFDLNVTVWI